MFSNSCQLAQGLVNDAASVLPDKVQSDMKMSTISFSKGVTDVFGALTNSSSQGDPVQQVKANAATDMQKVIQGNLVWRALNQNNAGGWFKFGGNEFLQAAMSVTGSVVVKPPKPRPTARARATLSSPCRTCCASKTCSTARMPTITRPSRCTSATAAMPTAA